MYRLDRFARNVASVTEPLGESPSGFITETMLSAIAEYFIRDLRAKVTSGLRKRAEQCIAYLQDEDICRAVDLVKDELLVKKSLDHADLEMLDPVNFELRIITPNGEIVDEPEESEDEDWYIDLVVEEAFDRGDIDDGDH